MSLLDKLNPTYQIWLEDAIELSENTTTQKFYEKITWYAIVHSALKRATPEVRSAFVNNIQDGVDIDDFTGFLEDAIKMQPETERMFEGKDDEFDAYALEWLRGIDEASQEAGEAWHDEVDAWKLFLEQADREVIKEFEIFFRLEKVKQDLNKLLIDVTDIQLFDEEEALDGRRFTKEALNALQVAAQRAAQQGMDFILPTHILAAILYADHNVIETCLRKNLPPHLTFIGFRDIVDSLIPIRQEHQDSLTLDKATFSKYSLAKLTDACVFMARRHGERITLLDLFAGLLEKDQEDHGGNICNILDNNQIDSQRVTDEIRLKAPDPLDEDPPMTIPHNLVGRDLTWEAQKQNAKKGFEALTADVMKVLYKKKRNSVIVLGETGIGRTSFVEQLALEMNGKDIKDLAKKRIIRLDCGRLAPQGKKTFLTDALQFVYGKKDLILCLDGLESVFLKDNEEENPTEAFLEQFQYALQKTDVQFLITIKPSVYHVVFREDFRLQKLFEVFEQKEPGLDLTREILLNLIPAWNQRFGMSISESAVEKAVQLTEQYMLSEYFPQKAIEVLEEAADSMTLEKEIAKDELSIGPDKVIEVVSKLTGVPEETLEGSTEDANFEQSLSSRVTGQKEAIDICAKELALIRSGMKDPEKPASVILFAGMTGTGKTELAKTIANLYSATKRLVTFTMGNFTEAHSISGIIGVPPGYVGAEEGGPLINEINKDPYCVVLLDEIEKAHPDIWKPFLNLFDEGWIVDKRNIRANASRSIFILTSNIGSARASDLYAEDASYEAIQKAVKEELYKAKTSDGRMPIFTPEFLARVQKIVVFRPLNREALKNILVLQLNKKAKAFQKSRNKALVVSPNVIDILADECHARYEESDGREGGRVVLKVIIEFIDTLIQSCPPQEFKRATTLEIEGSELASLRVKTESVEMSKQEAQEGLDQLVRSTRATFEMHMNEITRKFNSNTEEYKKGLGKNTIKISDQDSSEMVKHFDEILPKADHQK